jgi:hypothetical protein
MGTLEGAFGIYYRVDAAGLGIIAVRPLDDRLRDRGSREFCFCLYSTCIFMQVYAKFGILTLHFLFFVYTECNKRGSIRLKNWYF